MAQDIIRKHNGEWAATQFIDPYGVSDREVQQRLKSDPQRRMVYPSQRDFDLARTTFKAVIVEWAAKSPHYRDLIDLIATRAAKLRSHNKHCRRRVWRFSTLRGKPAKSSAISFSTATAIRFSYPITTRSHRLGCPTSAPPPPVQSLKISRSLTQRTDFARNVHSTRRGNAPNRQNKTMGSVGSMPNGLDLA